MDFLAFSAAFTVGHRFHQEEALYWVTCSAQQAVSIFSQKVFHSGQDGNSHQWTSLGRGWSGVGGSHYSEGNRHHNDSSLFNLSFLYLSLKH